MHHHNIIIAYYTHRSSAEMAINRNVSYEATEMVINKNINYKTIADSNPLSRQQQLPSGRNRVSASLSENYNSEPYLAMAASARPGGDGGGGVGQGEAAALDYEAPLNSSLSQSEGHEEYSRLQHRVYVVSYWLGGCTE